MVQSSRLIPITPQARRGLVAIRRIAIVAICAIGLGFFMQALIVLARLLSGGGLPGVSIVADLAGTVTWSFFVCTGVAIGVSLGRARAALAGVIGAVFAPLSLALAKGAQKVVAAAMEVSSGPSLLTIELVALIRAFEYGVLAFALVLLSERKVVRLAPYLWIGIGIGLVGGGFLSIVTLSLGDPSGTAPSAPTIARTVVSEIGFPIGCALLIYIGQLVGNSFTEVEKGALKMKNLTPAAQLNLR